MTVSLSLFRKGLLDARWMLGIIALALFGLCWLFVYVAHRIEVAMKLATGGRPQGMLRGLGGGAMDFSSAAIEMAFWNHPFVLLIVAIWAISRGSASVAGEIEKGTMDMILSRPVGRLAYLGSQVGLALFGFAVLTGSMMAGNLVGAYYNSLDAPLSALALARPALNLAAFGWAIFGYTCFVSTVDHVRWRPLADRIGGDPGRLHRPGDLGDPIARRLEVARKALDLQGVQPGRGRDQRDHHLVQRGRPGRDRPGGGDRGMLLLRPSRLAGGELIARPPSYLAIRYRP